MLKHINLTRINDAVYSLLILPFSRCNNRNRIKNADVFLFSFHRVSALRIKSISNIEQ